MPGFASAENTGNIFANLLPLLVVAIGQTFVLIAGGIDLSVTSTVALIMNDLAAQGAGLLLISSEIEELIGMCDRILAMSNGEIKDCVARSDFDRERILRAALGGGE